MSIFLAAVYSCLVLCMSIQSQFYLMIFKIENRVEVSDEDVAEQKHIKPFQHDFWERHDGENANTFIFWIYLFAREKIGFWHYIIQSVANSEGDVGEELFGVFTRFNREAKSFTIENGRVFAIDLFSPSANQFIIIYFRNSCQGGSCIYYGESILFEFLHGLRLLCIRKSCKTLMIIQKFTQIKSPPLVILECM